MSRENRKNLIRRLEEIRGSRVVCYVTGDRQPAPAQVGEDVVRPLISLLRQIGKVEKLDLFLYTKGGATDVPWRIVRQLRHHVAEQWRILIPYHANSAGTLIAIGADEIVLCGEAELGPIDPSMQVKRVGHGGTTSNDSVSVEDVMAYVRFLRERGDLTDETALSPLLGKLVDRVDPVALGNVYRTHSHIRDVAHRILCSRVNPPNEAVQKQIVETLTERVYAHGHAIGLHTAEEIGLPVTQADEDLDSAMWDLLSEYENDMKTRDPLDPMHAVGSGSNYSEDLMLATVETTDAAFEYSGQLEVKAKRNLPQNLNVSLTVNLQFPPDIDPATIDQQQQAVLQQLLQQAQQGALQNAQTAVLQALNAQAPLSGAEVALRGAKWQQVD